MPFLAFSRVGRRISMCASALVIVSTAACSDDATAPRSGAAPKASPAVGAPSLGIGANASPVIDGVMGSDEYTDAATTTFRIALPAPYGGTTVTVYAKRDKTNLYLATVYDRKSPILYDQVVFEFDNDNDGVREDGDDLIGTNSTMMINLPLNVMDMFRTNGGADSNHDDFDGGTRDVMSAWGAVGNTAVFEISHALDSDGRFSRVDRVEHSHARVLGPPQPERRGPRHRARRGRVPTQRGRRADPLAIH